MMYKNVNQKFIFLFLLCLKLTSLVAQDNVVTISESDNTIIVDFSLPEFSINDTSILEAYGINESYKYISIPDFGEIVDIGYPNLPQYTVNLMIPNEATTFSVSTSNIQSVDINLTGKIFPAQDVFIDSISNFIISTDYYQSDGSLFNFIYQLTDTFNVMGSKGISLTICPFLYNPSINKIEVIQSCRFLIQHNSSSSQLRTDLTFNNLKHEYLNNVFDNYPYSSVRVSASINKYLIITDSDFEETLRTFANYKRNIGYDVTVATTDIIGGTANNIKSYIQNQYNNEVTRPDFVLLVGDYTIVPASGGDPKGVYEDPFTDLNYARLDGGDYFADVFLGRISVSDIPQLHNIINKTIYMETNLHSIHEKAALLSGGGEGRKIFARAIRSVINYTFEFFNIDYDKILETEGATEQDGLDVLNGDYTLFVYSGHGSETSIGSPYNLDKDNIDSSTNSIYPFGFGFACHTNNFGIPECFGESWIRSMHGGVSYFGATTTVYANADNAILKNVLKQYPYRDQLSVFINAGMYRYYKKFFSWLSGKIRKRHIKAYNLLGDPSIFIRGIGCQEDFIFSNNEVFHSGDDLTYQASNHISTCNNNTTFIVQPESRLELVSGNEIVLKPGFHAVYGTDFTATINSCSSTNSARIIADESEIIDFNNRINMKMNDGIMDNKEIKIRCFPNPSKDVLNFQIEGEINNSSVLTIYDLLGNIRKTVNIKRTVNNIQNISIDITDLSNGTYLFKFSNEKGIETSKFIKQ